MSSSETKDQKVVPEIQNEVDGAVQNDQIASKVESLSIFELSENDAEKSEILVQAALAVV